MAEATCELIKSWKDRVIITKFIRMDNAGENKLFEQRKEQRMAVAIAGGVSPKGYTTA